MVVAAPKKAKKSKKQRKHGRAHRGRDYAKVYRLSHRREINKLRRIKKHLVTFHADKVALAAIDRLLTVIRGY